MKKNISFATWIGAFALSLLFFSCKKSNSAPAKSEKYQIVAGDWAQADIVLGVDVSVNVGGNDYNFPTGTSVITDPYLSAFGVSASFTPTVNNVYHFSDSGTYRIDGVTDLILPVAGNKGAWSLDVYDAVLKLVSTAKGNDPHWINSISSTDLSLSMIVDIPGMGTAPLTLLLKKK